MNNCKDHPIAEGKQAAEQPPSEPYYFVHATRYRITQPLTDQQWKHLRRKCDHAFMLDLHDKNHTRDLDGLRMLPIRRNYIKGYLDNPLVVIKPNDEALQLLDALHRVLVNYAELARDQIVADAEQVHDRFIEHFVQPRHGKHETLFRILKPSGESERAPPPQPNTNSIHRTTGTSYTGQRRRGHLFACYSDQPSKETGEVGCFHLEGRYQSARALRQLGIYRPTNLIDFPHEEFWENVLQGLYTIDFERLGRYNANRRRSARRRKPIVSFSARYNRDASEGGILYHVLGRHPCQSYHSVQRFIDTYKPRARPFLIPIRWSDLINPALSLPCETRPWETLLL